MHGYLYSLGPFICMGTTIQKVSSNWLNRYLYNHRVLVIDGYLYILQSLWYLQALLMEALALYMLMLVGSVKTV